MPFQWTHPMWLLGSLIALPWIILWSIKSGIPMARWKRGTILAIRLIVTLLVLLALAGMQWLRPVEGMNVVYLLDRSESLSPAQKQQSLAYVQRTLKRMQNGDRAGVVVFGSDAAIELRVLEQNALPQVQSVIDASRSDLEAAIRLGTATFPETGQKRLILLSDGNENLGDALAAMRSSLNLDVSMDVFPMGSRTEGDASIQRLGLPSNVKEGSLFEVNVFAQSDQAQSGILRVFVNDEVIGEDVIQLEAGKNLFTLNQQIPDSGFYTYEVQLLADQDAIAQNNRAFGFVTVEGDPRVLLLSNDPKADQELMQALRGSQLAVTQRLPNALPQQLPEMQSFDAIILSNVAAGELSINQMKLLQSAVRDFGVGLICIGGDQAFAAGGYRGTPLEDTLPLEMELSSQKVLPNGALVMVMHGMEFNNGNQIARQVATGVMQAMSAQDELGIVLWDGSERWLFELQPVKDKESLGRQIMGMNQGDLPSFQQIMSMGYEGLQQSSAQIKHMILFSDGDPGPPSRELMDSMVADKVTVSTILISGHAGPETMQWIAQNGQGRFYEVRDPSQLPQVFIKEASIILKTAIIEHPFQPTIAGNSEVIRGLGANGFPTLRGYVGSSPKARAEIPLISDQGDPILAHWQYGLGRSVAFTSDASTKWASDWVQWSQFQSFWNQVTRWGLRRMEQSNLSAEVTIDKATGKLHVEALDETGQFRHFLDLRASVVSPSGDSQTLQLTQTSPGHYETSFAAREVGAYTLQLREYEEDRVKSAKVLGTSVSFSPEFVSREPNLPLLNRLASESQGTLINPENEQDDPFERNRQKTLQAHALWPLLLKIAILLFPLDVGMRRIQLESGWVARAWLWLLGKRSVAGPDHASSSGKERMETLLRRRRQTRETPQGLGDRGAHEGIHAPQRPSEESAVTQPSPDLSQKESKPRMTDQPTSKTSTASRLLAAKRRQQGRDQSS